MIPRSALFRGAKGEWKVYSVVDGRAKETIIKLGLTNDEFVEVAAGLKQGDMVVLTPESSLAEGQKVRVAE